MSLDDTDEMPAHIVPMARLKSIERLSVISPRQEMEYVLTVNWLATYSTIQRRCARLDVESLLDCLPRPDGSAPLIVPKNTIGQC